MIKENAKLREIIKSRFRRQIIPFLFSFLLLIISILTGCENLQFNQSFREQLDEDLSVTYKFYETFDFTGNYTERTFYTGNTIYSSDFPVYTHEDELLVGWQYLGNQIPSNVKLNEREYISYVRVALKSESFFGVWKTKRYVTFVTNNDLVVNTAVVAEGYCVEAPQIEQKHGRFRFGGWYIDEELTEPYDFSTPVMEDITLYAKWIEFNTITYHKNDGTGETRVNESDIDIMVQIEDCFFGERKGYGFKGWATTSDGDATIFPGKRYDDLREDLDLYAVWTTDIITITYIDTSNNFTSRTARYGRGAHILVGRVLHENQNYYNYLHYEWTLTGKEVKGFSENADADLDNLEYDTYGWHQELLVDPDDSPILDEYGNQQTEWTSYHRVTEDTTFYAYWGDKLYNVYFRYYNAAGDECYFESQQVAYNGTAQRPDAVPYVPGYVFVDWYTSRWNSLTQRYELDDTPFDFTTVFNEETMLNNWGIDLFAKFEPSGSTEEIEIGLEIEASSESDIDVTYEYDTDTVTFTAPAGYDSYEWYFEGAKQTSQTTNVFELTKPAKYGSYEISLIVKKNGKYYSWSALLRI